jgi:hypothetical protein
MNLKAVIRTAFVLGYGIEIDISWPCLRWTIRGMRFWTRLPRGGLWWRLDPGRHWVEWFETASDAQQFELFQEGLHWSSCRWCISVFCWSSSKLVKLAALLDVLYIEIPGNRFLDLNVLNTWILEEWLAGIRRGRLAERIRWYWSSSSLLSLNEIRSVCYCQSPADMAPTRNLFDRLHYRVSSSKWAIKEDQCKGKSYSLLRTVSAVLWCMFLWLGPCAHRKSNISRSLGIGSTFIHFAFIFRALGIDTFIKLFCLFR